MESNSLSSFVRILRESVFIFLKNKSLMACIALLILLLHSFLVSCKFFSIKPLTKDFVMEKTRLHFTNPGSSQQTNIVTAMTADLHEIAGLEWFFFLALSMANLISSAITVLASAITYGEGNLSFRDLVSSSVKSWPRLFITWFYIFLFDLGYFFLVLLSIFPFALKFASRFHPTTFLYVILSLVLAFHMYLAVVWKMSIVVSVLEEKSGVDSFGKASQIMKGSKLQGFLLNLMFGIPGLIVFIYWVKTKKRIGAYSSLLVDLIFGNIILVMNMSLIVAYTVFYHKCKQSHGEEVELHGSFEYIKVSNEPMITT